LVPIFYYTPKIKKSQILLERNRKRFREMKLN